MEFLDVPFFDNDFYKMIFRFSFNMLFLFIIIRGLYFEKSHRKDYLFTYFLISIIVFFICFTLKKFELGLGVALGLFAIFGIIRYRTDPIPIKEMTYLFVVIGISVINALSNKKMSYSELLFANLIIVAIITILEKYWLLKHEANRKVVYEVIENIKPKNYELLKEDLENRTGLVINRVEVKNVDFLKDTAEVIMYYYTENQHDNYKISKVIKIEK